MSMMDNGNFNSGWPGGGVNFRNSRRPRPPEIIYGEHNDEDSYSPPRYSGDSGNTHFWTNWPRWVKMSVVGATALLAGHYFPPANNVERAVVGPVESSFNYASAFIKKIAYGVSGPKPVESSVTFPVVNGEDRGKQVSGVGKYVITRVQQDPKRHINTIGVSIQVDSAKLDEISDPTKRVEQQWRMKVMDNNNFYPFYVLHYDDVRMRIQNCNDLDRIAKYAPTKADSLMQTETQTQNFANSESAYAIQTHQQYDDPDRFNTYVGIDQGPGQALQRIESC